MYHPTERYAKAHQEELLREAYTGNPRPEPNPANTNFLSLLFRSLFSAKYKAPKHQPVSGEAQKGVRPSHPAHTRG
jgi:hypothetical protein